MIVQRNGQEKPLDLDTAQHFELYAAATTPVAPGDQLRITSNFRSNGDRFINNELVKVLSLDEQKMVVSRGNGKEAVISRRDLVHVDQGVTVTSYSSQSKGPDQMLCSAPVRSFGGPLVFRAITYGRNCGRFQRWMPFSGAHSTTC